MADTKEEEDLEFKWLKKRGIGGKKKEVQFYDSFVFDSENYSLYDCVYLYKDDEPEPYVGKLTKIWEQPGDLKKVKVLWFFRPIEVVNHIGDEEVLENELFLASGNPDSQGLTNINPLEAIAGKCNVVCTSKDVKNPQPSEEEIKAADYIFYRTFNVDTLKISDKIDEKIALVEDKFIYNRTDGKEPSSISKPVSGKTEDNGKIDGSADVSRPPVKLNALGLPENPAGCEKRNNSVRVEDEHLDAPGVTHGSLPCEIVAPKEVAITVDKQDDVLGRQEAQIKLEELLLKRIERNGKVSDTSTPLVQEKGNLKPVSGSDEADRPSKKARIDSSGKSSKKPQSKISKSLSLSKNKKEASPQISKKVGAGNLDNLARETQNTVSNSSSLSKGKDDLREQPSKKASIDSPVKSTEEPQSKISKSSSLSKDKKEASPQISKKDSADALDNLTREAQNTVSNSSSLTKGKDEPREQPSKKSRIDSPGKSAQEPHSKISSPSSLIKDKKEAGAQISRKHSADNSDKLFKEPKSTISNSSSLSKGKDKLTEQPSEKARDGHSSRTSEVPQPKISSPSSVNKEKNKDAVQTSKKTRVDDPVNSSKEPQPTISSPSSLNKDKNEVTVQPTKNGNDCNSVNSSNQPHATISTPSVVNQEKEAGVQEHIILLDSDEDDVVGVSGTMDSAPEDMSTSKIVVDTHMPEKVTLKDAKSGEKKHKLSNGNPSKPAVSRRIEKETSTDDQILEVGRRPQADRSKWFKGLPWRERMETAQDQGTLVLLENLDPSYTSAEVEDIIWHGFKENCTAKVVAKMAISSPHSGRAFVIFKSRDAAELVIEKLNDGCLMLPNGRPLVASRGSLPKSGKPLTLVGHLCIEKIKLQTQREDIKKAVSTSHCSQPNTIEYEMALEWCLLQTRADKYWKELYKQQGEETRKLRVELKSK
ncbi:hypothetical protein MKW94_024576 [Papaver nudicaule]|uniref:Uncharacterized protein n=1 Tax=Papaver nudicaule TaxID=74823 RepID=A0AA41VLE7_PAPNU|nr:hypothetical protein [Papaver nudicaule]